MSSAVNLECKKLCMFRCLYAVGLSIAMQYLLLTIFLLFVNFDIFHPITWIATTFRLMYSFYTWLSIMPLISSVIVFGILLGKSFLSVKKYYATRFRWFFGTALRKFTFLGIHLMVGFLTAWLYARFLHPDYRTLLLPYFDREVINSRYTFLVFIGISSGFYFFAKENLKNESEIEFPIIQEKKFIKIRSLVYSILYTSLVKSLVPTLCFAFVYWIIGNSLNRALANSFGSEIDETYNSLFTIFTSPRMLFYAWILCSQILSNMELMRHFFSFLLAEEMHFVVEKNPVVAASQTEVSLVEALALKEVPVVQQMACLDLYNLSSAKAVKRRLEVFALSIPGGHPYNWNQLSGQCLSLINEFTEELASSVKKISTMKNPPPFAQLKPSASETAERILLRQYNETYGIRRMMADPVEQPQPACGTSGQSNNPCDRVNEILENIQKSIEESAKAAFYAVPGVFYLFGEQDGAKTAFVLSNSQAIVWLTQGLAGICASSLHEDKYGVVQNELSKIIKSLLKLKLELDKLNNVNLNGKKLDRNLITLKNAVKRSLYRICTVFGDYMRDLVDEQDDLRNLQCFLSYQET
ncbi:nucleoporin Ndc1 [Episyrphus balteatus]|uniref:nucleoporin Ndc1 n=1 Tax=Episyrphus balteatus TaxID=286459 RepID=UPI002485EBF2|nr:nucleoporin Ndc1 [Episyrphus balteatus]